MEQSNNNGQTPMMSNQYNDFRLETYAERRSREMREETERQRAEEAFGWRCFKALVKFVIIICVVFLLALLDALLFTDMNLNTNVFMVVMVFGIMVLIVCESIMTYCNF